MLCKAIGCTNQAHEDFCPEHLPSSKVDCLTIRRSEESMSAKYPKYYKDTSDIDELDVYGVHQLFDLHDTTGCLHHASKKILLSGVRTGGKSPYKDIREARDTLTRWLQLNEDQRD